MPIDYSKFDTITDGSSDEGSAPAPRPKAPAAAPSAQRQGPAGGCAGGRPAQQHFWGPPPAVGETAAQRVGGVVLPVQHKVGSFADRFAKARECFRLGFDLFLEQDPLGCADALVEGLLLEERAMPECLALAHVPQGPESCPFGRIAESVEKAALTTPRLRVKAAFLQVQWLDMQMVLVRELVSRAQEDPEAAETFQQKWFDLVAQLDDLARAAVSDHSRSEADDRRILSRLTLAQAQYGENPPMNRPKQECVRLAVEAVDLWPEDITARRWAARREDLDALFGAAGSGGGLVEADAPGRAALFEKLVGLRSPGGGTVR